MKRKDLPQEAASHFYDRWPLGRTGRIVLQVLLAALLVLLAAGLNVIKAQAQENRITSVCPR
ncbi:MAG: hypothetical protein EOO08_07360 [Chitinophagaceae bacterium]|nr:MAG: hypothetical protein EOO08_07360 [Chitinophagaceae bacterium]